VEERERERGRERERERERERGIPRDKYSRLIYYDRYSRINNLKYKVDLD
jgi:hypothetical protein